MKSGYHGKKDAMREGAERAIGKAVRMAEGKEKESKSAMSKIQPRPYKKGGKAKKCNFGGLLKSEYAPTGTVSISKPDYGSALKKGGSVKKMAIGGVGKIRHKQSTKEGKPKKPR